MESFQFHFQFQFSKWKISSFNFPNGKFPISLFQMEIFQFQFSKWKISNFNVPNGKFQFSKWKIFYFQFQFPISIFHFQFVISNLNFHFVIFNFPVLSPIWWARIRCRWGRFTLWCWKCGRFCFSTCTRQSGRHRDVRTWYYPWRHPRPWWSTRRYLPWRSERFRRRFVSLEKNVQFFFVVIFQILFYEKIIFNAETYLRKKSLKCFYAISGMLPVFAFDTQNLNFAEPFFVSFYETCTLQMHKKHWQEMRKINTIPKA